MTATNRPQKSSNYTPPKITMAPGQGGQGQSNVPRKSSDNMSDPAIRMAPMDGVKGGPGGGFAPGGGPTASAVKTAGFRSGMEKAAAALTESNEIDNTSDIELALAILKGEGVDTGSIEKQAAEKLKKK
jgi:hypothetical protein